MLAENIGQPGFRELLLVVHDVDAHRDLVFALVAESRRRQLIRRPTSEAADARRAEVFDLAGIARDHLADAVAAALTLPLASDWHTVTFAQDGYWRGETHRLCDRPASLIRLIDELIGLGAEQLIVVSAAPQTPGPHTLAAARVDGRGRLGDYLQSTEAAVVQRRDEHDRRRAHLHHPARAQSDRTVRFRRRLRRSIASPAPARRADQRRIRGRVSPVHRAGRRRQRRTHAEVSVMRARMKGPATELIHAGEIARGDAVPLTTPIYETTTFVFDNAEEVVAYNEGRSSKFLYSRYTNPTVISAEQKLAALDRAESALVFSSGQGATTTLLMTHVKAGDEVVCSAAIYGGTLHLLQDVLARFGVTPRFVSLDELATPERVFSDRTRLVWFESPINPTLRCVDVKRIADACRARGVLSVIDNTFASPINQQPLALGVDLAMQSVTKYLNGHSDVTGGRRDRAGRARGADRESPAHGRAR